MLLAGRNRKEIRKRGRRKIAERKKAKKKETGREKLLADLQGLFDEARENIMTPVFDKNGEETGLRYDDKAAAVALKAAAQLAELLDESRTSEPCRIILDFGGGEGEAWGN